MTKKSILEGLRVLDASTVLAAPLAASLLGDFGAEVIKVEQPKIGDPSRNWGTNGWKVTGRNKKSITLNFREPKAVEVFYQLVKKSDVVILNYRPSTLKKWKIDYEDLKKVKENIVVLHLSAFGRNGPNSEKPGFARVAEAYSGLVYMTGYPDRKPIFSGYPVADAFGGVYGAFSVLLALQHYMQTGEGQLIDLSLYEPLVRVMEDHIVDYDIDGKISEREGTHNPRVAPNDLYTTKDNKWIVLPASTENMFKRLMKAIDRPKLIDDPRFLTNELRIAHREELDEILNEFFSKHDQESLFEIMEENEVAYGPLYSVEDLFNDPHMKERENLVSVFDPELNKEITMQGIMPKLSKTPGEVKWVGQTLGSHNKEIYQGLLGFTDDDLKRLNTLGVI